VKKKVIALKDEAWLSLLPQDPLKELERVAGSAAINPLRGRYRKRVD
jgi:hypothetical protein